MNYPLLITLALVPPSGTPFLKMTDTMRRKLCSKAGLYQWAAKGIKKIVIADATNALLLTDEECDELGKFGVEIEQIRYCQDDEMIKNKGKGFGEGMLIQYAIENSTILKGATHFFKSSGKVFVRNFSDIRNLIEVNTLRGIFWRHCENGDLGKQWADCRFYFSQMDFAIDILVPAYLRADDKIAACEHHIFNQLNQKYSAARSVRPLIHGYAGGTDQEYFDAPLGYLDSNFPCWISRN